MSARPSSIALQTLFFNELVYWINRVIFYRSEDNWDNQMQMRLTCRQASGNQAAIYSFSMHPLGEYGEPVKLHELVGDDLIIRVCYQCYHPPSGLLSPIYDHEYTRAAPSTRGYPIDMGKCKLYPLTKTWPELVKKGYTGSMPQLIS